MARFPLLTGALAAAIALGAVLPAMAQNAPPPPPAKQAAIKLDFGMGRKVHVECGDLALAACMETAKPVIDQVANAPLPQMMPRGHKDGHKGGPKGERGKPPQQDDNPSPAPAQ